MHPLTPAYVLHARPYRDSSALVELLTLYEGMQRVVWRGARNSRKGPGPQPFVPLLVSTTGRGELKTLGSAEIAGSYTLLQGDCLFSGMYLNELLVRLLRPADPQPILFAAYQGALQALGESDSIEPILRRFEWQLLDALGYGFSLQVDALGEAVDAEGRYTWAADQGLLRLTGAHLPANAGLPGEALLRMAADDWTESTTLRAAKLLMRQALSAHLGDKPLMSRQLFSSAKGVQP